MASSSSSRKIVGDSADLMGAAPPSGHSSSLSELGRSRLSRHASSSASPPSTLKLLPTSCCCFSQFVFPPFLPLAFDLPFDSSALHVLPLLVSCPQLLVDPTVLAAAHAEGNVVQGTLLPPKRLQRWREKDEIGISGVHRAFVLRQGIVVSLVHALHFYFLIILGGV